MRTEYGVVGKAFSRVNHGSSGTSYSATIQAPGAEGSPRGLASTIRVSSCRSPFGLRGTRRPS